MQLGTRTNGLGGPSIRASLGHSVAACSCTSSTSQPQFTNHHSPIATHKSTLARPILPSPPLLIANAKLLETGLTPSAPIQHAFPIDNMCPTFFSPALLRALLIGTRSRLERDLTHSQQTRKDFLIGTIRPTFASAPLFTHHLSLITHHCLTSFLIATNETHKILALLKTKEKPRSIRYKFPLRGISLPGFAAHISLITTHQSPLTNSTSALDSVHLALLIVGRTSIQERS